LYTALNTKKQTPDHGGMPGQVFFCVPIFLKVIPPPSQHPWLPTYICGPAVPSGFGLAVHRPEDHALTQQTQLYKHYTDRVFWILHEMDMIEP